MSWQGNRHRRQRREQWPHDGNHFADGGNQGKHVEVRHAEQPQADGGGSPDDRGEQQLAAEPRTHFGRDAKTRVLYAPPFGAREQANERPHHGVAVDEHVEGENQDRDEAEDRRR